MEEDANSWVRRAKFSHTVYHRLDSSRLAILNSFNSPIEKRLQFKPRPEMTSWDRNPVMSFKRYPSPLPKTHVPDIFKEAQAEMRRFSSPFPQREKPEKGIASKEFNKEILPPPKLNSKPVEGNNNKSKNQKESSWIKCFDHGGGRRVTAVEATDEYVVDLSMLFIGLRFAHGAHSRLYHGVYKDQPVAVKIIRVPNDENNDLGVRLEKQFNREVTLLSHLCHQNVIRFIAACREPPIYCVITEYLSKGSLRAYLHKLEHKSLQLGKLLPMALDIARGMEYIHSQRVIHRDLKPENVLISEDFHMKIVDFGIACEEAHCDSLMDDPGTFRWMAPEMIKRKSYGRKVDVYSFGLILWEMVAGKIPYEDMTPIQAAFAVVNKNLRPLIPADCPAGIGALIEQCWSLQPHKRPEFWQVMKVLEKLEESLLEGGGTLNQQFPKPPLPVETSTARVHHHHHHSAKKGLLHWIQKLNSDFHS